LVLADALITPYELNPHHGTGIFLRRIFRQQTNLVCIRSCDYYAHANHLGAENLSLAHPEGDLAAAVERVRTALHGTTIARILCVPYRPDDLWTALALKELFNVPLCTFVMDDHNIYCPGLPDELFAAVWQRSALRLAIAPEMQHAYAGKFGGPVHLLPPVVAPDLVGPPPAVPISTEARERIGILIGNIWSPAWLTALQRTIHGAGLRLHWYGGGHNQALHYHDHELASSGIVRMGHVPEAQLIAALRRHPFAVVPSGTLDQTDGTQAIAQLSWPSRLPFIVATAQTPIVVLGHPDTAAARFVTRLGVGITCPYAPVAYRAAAETLTTPSTQRRLRATASTLVSTFSAHGLADWIWASLAQGQPCDDRFVQLEAWYREK
jgi:hypothetical protein